MASRKSDGHAYWVPLESNPEVLTEVKVCVTQIRRYANFVYTRELGVKVGEWVDVFSLDEDTLAIIPQPVLAVVLLFPVSDKEEQLAKEEDEALKAKGQEVSPDVYYMQQVVHNACGTVGVLHSLANNDVALNIQDGVLKDFLDQTKSMSPLERGNALENSEKIKTIHERFSEQGQTAAPDREDNVITHFVAFVHKDGALYELDGSRTIVAPVNHGPTSPKDLLKDAAAVCKSRMERNPDEYRFTVVALTGAD